MELTKITFLFLSVIFFCIVTAQSQRVCPPGWVQDRNSCYMTGERFNGLNFYEASAFCQAFGLGAHLAEPNDMQELNLITNLVKQRTWVDGPWLNLLRPFGDRRWVLPSQRTANMEMERMFGQLAASANYDCGGMDKYGNNLGFWRCRNGGSPVCEIDLM